VCWVKQFVFGCLLSGFVSAVNAQSTPARISVDEDCHGTLTFLAIFATLPCSLVADPGPGGRASAMTYLLLGPPALVAGDLLLLEPITGAVSDVLRFNPAGTGGDPGYLASLVFYSDISDGVDALADTGFPTLLYTNALSLVESGPEAGPNGQFGYTPTADQPGFVPSFSVTYSFLSDAAGTAVAEPTPLMLITAALAALAISGWRGRAHSCGSSCSRVRYTFPPMSSANSRFMCA